MEDRMRVLTWALDSWKTPVGKIISVILSFALVFSMSNVLLYSSEAYAESMDEATSEETEIGSDTAFQDEVSDEMEESTTNDASDEEFVVEEEPEESDELDADLEQPAADTPKDDSEIAQEDELTPYADAQTRIYVYLDVQGDASGWNQNKNGWYTIGYLDVPASELPDASNGIESANGFDPTPYLSSITWYGKNEGLITKSDLYSVDWAHAGDYGLRTSYGATDYDYEAPGKDLTWHLNGYLYINGKYSVTYTYEGADGIKLTNTINENIKNDRTEGVTGSTASEAPQGYQFLGWYKGDEQITGALELTEELAKWNVADFNGKKIDTTFVAKYAKEVTVSYAWENAPAGVTLPELPVGKTLACGDTYTVTDTSYDPIYTYDQYGNANGAYTFKGWSLEGSRVIEEDTIIYGTWSPYKESDVSKHQVSYTWKGLPTDAKLYNESGEEVAPKVPESITGLVKNQPYTVDTEKPGTVVYTHDAYGNPNGKYTLGSWKIGEDVVAGEQTMGEADVIIEGSWTMKPITVPGPWKITYDWGTENVPAGVTEPTDAKIYTNNEPYTVDTAYGAGYTVNTYDDYNNLTGTYTFSGWQIGTEEAKDGNITRNLNIHGKWTYKPQTVATHKVTYSWTGLPNEDLYDATGNAAVPGLPGEITGLVKNQSYAVDDTMPGTVVYTHDSYGNKTASYMLTEWNDVHGGIMSDADHEVSATWVKTDIDNFYYNIAYKYEGDVPETAPVAPGSRVAALNQPVDIMAAPSPINGWTFEGWTLPEGIEVVDGKFALSEMPSGTIWLTGKWVADGVDNIDVDSVDVVYDGQEHPLTVTGTLNDDEIRFEKTNGNEFSNDAKNVTNETVVVKVYRDGVLIKTLETSVVITPAPLSVEISGNTDEVFYNASAQSVEGFTYKASAENEALPELPEGVELNLVRELPAVASGTNAGTYNMGLTGTSFMFRGDNVKNYKITQTINDGQLTIKPAPVMLIVAEASKNVGDADPAFGPGAVIGSIYNDEVTFDYYRTNADEAAGTYDDVITAAVRYANNASGNYDVTVIPADFTINAVDAPAVPGPGTPAVPPAGPGAPAGPGVPAAVPAAAPVDGGAPAAAVIPDDGVPMAQAPGTTEEAAGAEEEIADDANPLGIFDDPECWVHWWMLMGIVLTVIYGAAVALRRISYARRMDDFEDDVLGVTPEAQKSTATGHVAQGA
ncbi:MAG: hypothetical protein HFJ65_06590 [Eggerthellaceae bacterium]|nr:hypothetical protein [Eggerthellaceae bacterium]